MARRESLSQIKLSDTQKEKLNAEIKAFIWMSGAKKSD